MSEGLSTRTVWRELSRLQSLLPAEHQKHFGLPLTEVFEWCGNDIREAFRVLNVLESTGVLTIEYAIGGFISVELHKPLRTRSIEELYGDSEPWGRVESC